MTPNVTITGANFVATPTITVGGQNCTNPTFVSASSVTCNVPLRIVATSADVVVTNPDHQQGTLAGGFAYTGHATYSLLKNQIFDPICASCHGGNGGLYVDQYSSISNYVVSGNHGSSILYQQVFQGKMPQGGPVLSSDEMSAIADWIDQGAGNN